MLNRREFLKIGGLSTLALTGIGCPHRSPSSDGNSESGVLVNDIHSQLNETRVKSIATPQSQEALSSLLKKAHAQKQPVCVAGARHAMGAQQFATGATLIDTRSLNRVLGFDAKTGLVTVEAGIAWPELVEHLIKVQKGSSHQWGIAQKQTGADRLTLGGALGANAHGRGLKMKPLISDVESLVLLDAHGTPHTCSRTQNPELFKLAIGGYGLFGIVYSITLRLVPRRKLQRVVEVIEIDDVTHKFEQRIADGYLYGDFQYGTDEKSPSYMSKGVFSCYRPVPLDTPLPESQQQVTERQWSELVYLAHTDKARAFQLYSDYYVSTSGQIYWSDTHQLGAYLEDYHKKVDKRMKAEHPATEMIGEIYVPRNRLADFMAEAAADFRRNLVNVIYGTIRLIERDTESFLAWAKDDYACVIFNLHVEHTDGGISGATAAFRRLIDMAIQRQGSYYLTYHKWATRKQVEACYPQFAKFLAEKKHHDPSETLQSDWYCHYKKLFT